MARNELITQSLKKAHIIKRLNAFISLSDDKCHSKEEGKGRLSGVPFVVKDNFCTTDFKTTCASKMLENFKPGYDATVVTKLKNEGAVILGKTNLDEFAMGSGTTDSHFGPTKNIWGSTIPYTINGKRRKAKPVWRVAGGSSGGSAVAVAAGCAQIGIGSDTGGSTRNPASYCGVVGFKPTYSTVSRHGLIPLVNSMDVPGILTQNVDTAALVYSIISGRDPKDSTTVEVDPFTIDDNINLSALKVGILREGHVEGLADDVLDAWKKVAHMLQEAGAQVSQVSVPYSQASIVCYGILNQCEVASNLARYDGLRYGHRTNEKSSLNKLYSESRTEGFGVAVRGRILAGNYFLLQKNYQRYFEKAMKVRRLICDDFKRVWDEYDVLLTPTTTSDAPEFDKFIQRDNIQQIISNDFFTVQANMSGCPAISIPITLSKNELPIGLQLLSRNYSDGELLSVAKWIEKQMNFPKLLLTEKSE